MLAALAAVALFVIFGVLHSGSVEDEAVKSAMRNTIIAAPAKPEATLARVSVLCSLML